MKFRAREFEPYRAIRRKVLHYITCIFDSNRLVSGVVEAVCPIGDSYKSSPGRRKCVNCH